MYRPTYNILLCLVSLLGIAETGMSFAAHQVTNNSTYEALIWETEPEGINYFNGTTESSPSVEQLYRQLTEQTSAATAAHTHYLMGGLAAQLSRDSGEEPSLCRSLTHFEEAIQRAPARSLYHLSWAYTAAELLQPSNEPLRQSHCCPREVDIARNLFPEAEDLDELIRARLDWAQDLEPLNVLDLYLASLVYRRLGDKARALSLLSRVQRLNPLFTEEQQHFFYRMIASEDDLARAVTRSYPGILNWIGYFSEQRPRQYEAWEDTFAVALQEAIDGIPEMLIQGTLLPEALPRYLKQSERLSLLARYDSVRRSLDRYLVEIYEREKNLAWAELLRLRKDMARVPVVKAYFPKDVRPRDTMLAYWHVDSSPLDASLSRRNASLGVFLPEGRRADMLVLKNQLLKQHVGETKLELLKSDDNQIFRVVDLIEPVRSYKVDGREALVITLSETGPLYLKLRLANYDVPTAFKNNLSSLIQVYGREHSTEDEQPQNKLGSEGR